MWWGGGTESNQKRSISKKGDRSTKVNLNLTKKLLLVSHSSMGRSERQERTDGKKKTETQTKEKKNNRHNALSHILTSESSNYVVISGRLSLFFALVKDTQAPTCLSLSATDLLLRSLLWPLTDFDLPFFTIIIHHHPLLFSSCFFIDFCI